MRLSGLIQPYSGNGCLEHFVVPSAEPLQEDFCYHNFLWRWALPPLGILNYFELGPTTTESRNAATDNNQVFELDLHGSEELFLLLLPSSFAFGAEKGRISKHTSI